MARFTVCVASTFLLSCFQTPLQTKGVLAEKVTRGESKPIAGTLAENGVATAAVEANSKETQLVNVPSGSAVAGSSLLLPPGALSISTQILIEEASPLTTATSLSELSIQSEVLQQGTAVSIQASDLIDAKVPMTIAIPLPTGFGLAETEYTRVAVLYRVTRNDQASNVSGIIPYAQISFQNGFAKVQSLYFGAYQVIVTSVPLEAKEVKVETPAFTKSTLENKPKITLTSASEVVIQKNRSITIHGTNFRSNMVLALGTTKISNLKIASDVQASFVAVDGDRGGRMALTAEQDGSTSSIPVFFLPSAENLPIITLLPAEVCGGTRYFDRSGQIQIGLRNCTAEVSGLSAGDLREGVKFGSITGSLAVYSPCASDGEAGCVVLGPTYAALLTTGAAGKILSGNTIGSVTGNVTLPAVAKVLSPTTFGVAGTGSSGTLTLPLAADVKAGTAAYGESGSQFTPAYSPDLPSLANVRSVDTVDGVSGTLGDCSSANQSGCVATSTYKTMDLSLVGSSPGLDTATFDAKVKSSAAFEYWNSQGTRQTGAGDSDIVASNISSGVSVFGLSGDLTAAVPPEPWDVRVGTVINGVTGQLKTSCRNRINTTRWDGGLPYTVTSLDFSANTLTIPSHPFISNMTVRIGAPSSQQPGGTGNNDTTYYVIYLDANTIKLSATSGPGSEVDITSSGTNVTVYQWSDGTLDWWDTIEDSNFDTAFPSSTVAAWTNDTDCNYSNWQDLTTDGTCDTAGDNCIMKDKISGLTWSESYPVVGAAPTSTTLSWQKAIQHCNELSWGGDTGWRLPTQKELMEAYIHGIRDVGYTTGTARGSGSTHNNNQFILNLEQVYWSASVYTYETRNAWAVYLNFGDMMNFAKLTSQRVICVR